MTLARRETRNSRRSFRLSTRTRLGRPSRPRGGPCRYPLRPGSPTPLPTRVPWVLRARTCRRACAPTRRPRTCICMSRQEGLVRHRRRPRHGRGHRPGRARRRPRGRRHRPQPRAGQRRGRRARRPADRRPGHHRPRQRPGRRGRRRRALRPDRRAGQQRRQLLRRVLRGDQPRGLPGPGRDQPVRPAERHPRRPAGDARPALRARRDHQLDRRPDRAGVLHPPTPRRSSRSRAGWSR